MLVYLKGDMAYSKIGEQRVYGRKFSMGRMGPTNISYELYKKNKYKLIEAQYTQEWLENKFNRNFPPISFYLNDLDRMSIELLIEIANCVGIDYIKSRWVRKQEQRALSRSIKNIIKEI